MGLLDDAIREHLELKRRRGEDAAELARLEHDAFGPIRGRDDNGEDAAERRPESAAHEPPAAAEPVGAEEPHAGHDALAEDETRIVAEHDPLDEPEPEAPRVRATADPLPPVAEPEPLMPDPEPLPAEPPPLPPEPAPLPPEPAPLPPDEPLPADPGPPPAEPEPLASDDPQATVAFSLEEEEAVAAGDAGEDPPDPDTVAADEEHDELEETPEFLQETPEHDRLWFEQKPPRDFDF